MTFSVAEHRYEPKSLSMILLRGDISTRKSFKNVFEDLDEVNLVTSKYHMLYHVTKDVCSLGDIRFLDVSHLCTLIIQSKDSSG